MKCKLFCLFTFLVLSFTMHAQDGNGQLNIQLSKSVLQPGDSLLIDVSFKNNRGQALYSSLATLQLMIENEQGMRTSLRWPMINGQASGTLYMPDSLKHGKYTLLAGLQPRFFEVVGKIAEGNNSRIQAMLFTKAGNWDEQEVTVSSNGTFAIRNWLFEDNALLAFSGANNSREQLNIVHISTQLDSSYRPLAVAGRSFYVGNPPSTESSTLDLAVATSESIFADGGALLPAVVVRSTAKTRAQQYDEEYVSGMFRSADERVISIMDDPTATGALNVFSYLQGRVAGLQIIQSFNGAIARWRGSPVTFFMDEIRTSPQFIANIPMSDIAIIKAYPPPFFGSSGGGGGGIAIYTRRGGEDRYLPPNRQVFRVRGYSPSSVVLDMNRLSL